jgi:hypothetical protein
MLSRRSLHSLIVLEAGDKVTRKSASNRQMDLLFMSHSDHLDVFSDLRMVLLPL